MSASHEPMTPQEAVELLESAGNEMSASGYFPLRYFFPRTVHYGTLDLSDVEDMPRYLDAWERSANHPEYKTPEEREEDEALERAASVNIWPYLRDRTKRRRKRARIIHRIMRAQALLARCQADTWRHAVILALVNWYTARLAALDEGSAQ